MSPYKNQITNLANFKADGALGALLAQARTFNHLNDQLSAFLPPALVSLSLCTIKNHTATFVTHNQAIAFRAQKQHDVLLAILNRLEALPPIQKVVIKIDLKEY